LAAVYEALTELRTANKAEDRGKSQQADKQRFLRPADGVQLIIND
jgi:hypothetical protein